MIVGFYYQDTEKEITHGIDNGYLGDENLDDSFITYTRSTPAFFKNCINCKKVNDNPHYQSCYKCFKVSIYKIIIIICFEQKLLINQLKINTILNYYLKVLNYV